MKSSPFDLESSPVDFRFSPVDFEFAPDYAAAFASSRVFIISNAASHIPRTYTTRTRRPKKANFFQKLFASRSFARA